MLPPVKPVPRGFHTITPHLCVKGAAAAIEFYTLAFGADELARLDGPDDTVAHATLAIGDSLFMINDEHEAKGLLGPASIGGTPVTLHIYVDDVDALFARAIDAGAEVLMPVTDMFWGDRYGMVTDPFGHRWAIATHTEDLTIDEIRARWRDAPASTAS